VTPKQVQAAISIWAADTMAVYAFLKGGSIGMVLGAGMGFHSTKGLFRGAVRGGFVGSSALGVFLGIFIPLPFYSLVYPLLLLKVPAAWYRKSSAERAFLLSSYDVSVPGMK
jgi:hypothetical protein